MPFSSTDVYVRPLDHLKLLDDPSSAMKFPEPQPVQPFALVGPTRMEVAFDDTRRTPVSSARGK